MLAHQESTNLVILRCGPRWKQHCYLLLMRCLPCSQRHVKLPVIELHRRFQNSTQKGENSNMYHLVVRSQSEVWLNFDNNLLQGISCEKLFIVSKWHKQKISIMKLDLPPLTPRMIFCCLCFLDALICKFALCLSLQTMLICLKH